MFAPQPQPRRSSASAFCKSAGHAGGGGDEGDGGEVDGGCGGGGACAGDGDGGCGGNRANNFPTSVKAESHKNCCFYRTTSCGVGGGFIAKHRRQFRRTSIQALSQVKCAPRRVVIKRWSLCRIVTSLAVCSVNLSQSLNSIPHSTRCRTRAATAARGPSFTSSLKTQLVYQEVAHYATAMAKLNCVLVVHQGIPGYNTAVTSIM